MTEVMKVMMIQNSLHQYHNSLRRARIRELVGGGAGGGQKTSVVRQIEAEGLLLRNLVGNRKHPVTDKEKVPLRN